MYAIGPTHHIMYMYIVVTSQHLACMFCTRKLLYCVDLFACVALVVLYECRGFIPLQSHIDYQGKLKRFTNILNHLVSTDMDFTQLDAYLTSQMRRRQVSTSGIYMYMYSRGQIKVYHSTQPLRRVGPNTTCWYEKYL
jgi:hypothetical protein